MAVVGIALASIAAVGPLARAVKVRGRREAVPSLLWALAMLAVVVALGWDMRFTIVAAVLSVTGAFPGRKYKVAL
jgi:hypothetical protein